MTSIPIEINRDVVRGRSVGRVGEGLYVCTGVPGTGYYTRDKSAGQLARPLVIDIMRLPEKPEKKNSVFENIASVFYTLSFIGMLLAGGYECYWLCWTLLGTILTSGVVVISWAIISGRKERQAKAALEADKDAVVFEYAKPFMERARIASANAQGIRKMILGNFVDCYQKGNLASPMNVDEGLTEKERSNFSNFCNAFEDMMTCDLIVSQYQREAGNEDTIYTEKAALYVGVFNGLVSGFDIPVMENKEVRIYLYPRFVVVSRDTVDFEVLGYDDVDLDLEYFLYLREKGYPDANPEQIEDGRFRNHCASIFINAGGQRYVFIVSSQSKANAFLEALKDFVCPDSDYYPLYTKPAIALTQFVSREAAAVDENMRRIWAMVDFLRVFLSRGYTLDDRRPEGIAALYFLYINFPGADTGISEQKLKRQKFTGNLCKVDSLIMDPDNADTSLSSEMLKCGIQDDIIQNYRQLLDDFVAVIDNIAAK